EGAQAYLLDHNLEPVSVGELGEMYLGGPRLADGYLDRPAWTAERFLPDPFATEPGGRFFRSGDLALLRPDGDFEFKGRTDQQVKILGNRVELAEIERVLSQCPGVRAAVVAVRPDDRGENQLVAYIVAERDRGATMKGL